MKQIVLIAMLDSVHTVRWLRNWQSWDEVEITLIPSGPHRRIHPDLSSLLQPEGPVRVIKGASFFGGFFSFAMDKFFGTELQLRYLRQATFSLANSSYFLHYLETQHSGYLALKFLRQHRPDVVVGSNWGSDLYWFRRFEPHRKKITELLEKTDRYLVECERDYEFAKELGFGGQTTIVGPNSFIHQPRLGLSKENLIVLKGYQGWAGLSHTALRALARARSQLENFKIVVYSASLRTRIYAKLLGVVFSLDIASYPKHFFNQHEMLQLFARSRIYIGASRTDGISTSALEAMNQGALPIQTNTSCFQNIVNKGVIGFAPAPTEEELYFSIKSALQLIERDNEYIQKNDRTLRNFASEAVARRRFLFAYDL